MLVLLIVRLFVDAPVTVTDAPFTFMLPDEAERSPDALYVSPWYSSHVTAMPTMVFVELMVTELLGYILNAPDPAL